MDSPSNQKRRKSSRIGSRRSTPQKDNKEGGEVKKVEVMASTSEEAPMENVMDPQTPENKALSIELILEGIISKLDASTKTARLVSKQWKRLADKVIRKRDLLRLRFDPKSRPFSEGLKELQNAKDLPCSDFHLALPKNVKLAEVKNFISIFGKQIKSVSLNSAISDNKILLAILNGSPSLETLNLSYNFIDKMGHEGGNIPDKLSPAQLSLKSLRHLKYLGHPDIPCLVVSPEWYGFNRVYPIIQSAINLVSIDNMIFGFDTMKDVSNGFLNRVHQIKSASDTYVGADILTFASSKPQLERFFINPFHYYYHKYSDTEKAAINSALNKIFVSSKSSMKELALTPDFLDFSDNFSGSFPHFENLEVLKLKIGQGSFYQSLNLNDYFKEDYLLEFSQSQDLQQRLPKLKTICFGLTSKEYDGQMKGTFTPLPPDFSNKLYSVENLIIEGIWNADDLGNRHCNWEIDINSGWLERVKDLFPNIKCVTLKDSSYLNSMLPKFFQLWPNLESLELHIRFLGFSEWYSECGDKDDDVDYEDSLAMALYPNLDSMLTGLPVEVCESLASKTDEDNDEKIALDIDSRTAYSLLSLKALKKVDFIFDDIRTGIAETKCPISHVSCLYAFKLIPNLKVTIRYPTSTVWNFQTKKFNDPYNLDKYFEQLAPYCDFGHWRKPAEFHSFLTRLC